MWPIWDPQINNNGQPNWGPQFYPRWGPHSAHQSAHSEPMPSWHPYSPDKSHVGPTWTCWLGNSPVHSAADRGHAQCLQLLIDSGFDVNALLDQTISDNYSDMRRSTLYFAVSNGDVTCTEMLLNAGAKTDLDPLHCLLVAVRAGRYEIVRILLAGQADVNCYFTEVNDTVFPIALQYCLKDEEMMQLLLNNVYDVGKCFHCHRDFHFNMGFAWKDMHLHKPCCYICDGGDKKIPVSFGPDYKKFCSKAYIDNILSTLFPAS